MNYSEAKQVLDQQEKAKAVLAQYEKLSTAHETYGFKSRREFIKALQEVDRPGSGQEKRATKGKKRGTRGLPVETIDRIQKMKAEGITNAEISRTVNVSPLTVAKYVKGAAGTVPAKTKDPAKQKAAKPGRKGKKAGGRGIAPETVDRIQQLKSEGKSNAEISRITGVGPITVAKYVKGQKIGAKAAATEEAVTAK